MPENIKKWSLLGSSLASLHEVPSCFLGSSLFRKFHFIGSSPVMRKITEKSGEKVVSVRKFTYQSTRSSLMFFGLRQEVHLPVYAKFTHAFWEVHFFQKFHFTGSSLLCIKKQRKVVSVKKLTSISGEVHTCVLRSSKVVVE
jgi:hypothetical protein